jgi:hypothetical protein
MRATSLQSIEFDLQNESVVKFNQCSLAIVYVGGDGLSQACSCSILLCRVDS